MNRKFKLSLLAVAMVGLAACTKVPAGYVGVKVYLLGGNKGVNSEELPVGRHWQGINEEIYLFPTFSQNYVWTRHPSEGSPDDESISFQTNEGLTVNADVGITYRINPAKATTLFERYRKGVDEITDIYLRNMVRDALVTHASSRPVESVYGEGKSELMAQVEAHVRDQVEEIGLIVERIYWIGEMRLPTAVIESLNRKIEATQRAQQRENEVQESIAEAKKKIEEARGIAQSRLLIAQSQADANRIVAESLTDELIRYKALEQWDGVLPRLMGSGAVPFINVDEEKK